MKSLAESKAPRRAINLSISRNLVNRARRERLNLSSIAEQAISRALAQVAETRFREKVALSVAEHAEYLADYGSLADAVRKSERNNGSLTIRFASMAVCLPSSCTRLRSAVLAHPPASYRGESDTHPGACGAKQRKRSNPAGATAGYWLDDIPRNAPRYGIGRGGAHWRDVGRG